MFFKRYEGVIGSIPQKFIDNNLPVCPICGSERPNWVIGKDDELLIYYNQYYFKCSTCKAILSSPVINVYHYSDKKKTLIYLKVDSIGSQNLLKLHVNRKYSLDDLKEMAENTDRLIDCAGGGQSKTLKS